MEENGRPRIGLSLQTYAALSIAGRVGTVYQIQYATDLTQTNNASAWRCLDFLQLPTNPYLWDDKSSIVTLARHKRVRDFC